MKKEITAAQTATANHAYCMNKIRTDLTVMSKEGVEAAAKTVREGRADLIVVSTAYHVWNEELALKLEIFDRLGIRPHQIARVDGILDSYGEVDKILDICVERYIKRLLICADSYQGPRAVRAFKKRVKKRSLDIEIVPEFFITSAYEATYEPHPIPMLAWLKGWRVATEKRWKWWNKLMP